MEKRTPHCKLAVGKSMLASGKVRATVSALAGGAALGFGFQEIRGVVAALMPRDFYKSMTTQADHRVWQDVYRPKTTAGQVYLKLTVLDGVPIMSFKRLCAAISARPAEKASSRRRNRHASARR
jgi:motility quorum-sensing regulator/GCU-specific mRNA interferase toxin